MAEIPLLRTSERQTFKRCPQKWYWTYVMGLRPKRFRPALLFGDLVHQSLAIYYKPGRKRGPKPARTFERLYMKHVDEHGKKYVRDLEGDDRVEMGELGIEILNNYIAEYGDDDDIEVLFPEFTFKVLLRDVGGKPFWYIGRMDALIRWVSNDRTGLFEHKTGSEQLKSHLGLDEQAGSYWTFAPRFLRRKRILKKNEDIDMILYNFMRKVKADDRPKDKEGRSLNMDGSVSKRQPTPRFERIPVFRDVDDRITLEKRVRQERFIIRMAEDKKIPIVKNPTKDCSWDCQFVEMCELHETRSYYQDFMRDQFTSDNDPYEDYKGKEVNVWRPERPASQRKSSR